MAELVPGDSATVVVQVRSISSRSVRRRGMRPLVEATVADDSGAMKATFFNQPWLEQRYPVGTRLALHGKFEGRQGRRAGAGFRVQGHARTAEAVSGGDATVAHYPATEGLTSTQILALVREHAAALADVFEPLPAALRVRARLPDRAAALTEAHFAGSDAGLELARRRLAFDELLLVQLALLRRRRRRSLSSSAPVLDAERSLTASVALRHAAVRFDGRSDARSVGGGRRPVRVAADAAVADGGGGIGQDRRRAVRAAARGRARLPGSADGADGDARRAAFRDDSVFDARLGGAVWDCSPDRRRDGAGPTCSGSSDPGSCR